MGPDNPGAREWSQTRVLVLPREVRVGGVVQGVTGDSTHGIKVRYQVSERKVRHRSDFLDRLPVAITERDNWQPMLAASSHPQRNPYPGNPRIWARHRQIEN